MAAGSTSVFCYVNDPERSWKISPPPTPPHPLTPSSSTSSFLLCNDFLWQRCVRTRGCVIVGSGWHAALPFVVCYFNVGTAGGGGGGGGGGVIVPSVKIDVVTSLISRHRRWRHNHSSFAYDGFLIDHPSRDVNWTPVCHVMDLITSFHSSKLLINWILGFVIRYC